MLVRPPTSLHTSSNWVFPFVIPFNPHPPHPKKDLTVYMFEENSNTKKIQFLRTFHQLSPSSKKSKKSFPAIKPLTRANYYSYSIIPKPEFRASTAGIPLTYKHLFGDPENTGRLRNAIIGPVIATPFGIPQPTIRFDKISSRCIKRSDSPSSIRSTGTPDLRNVENVHGRKPMKKTHVVSWCINIYICHIYICVFECIYLYIYRYIWRWFMIFVKRNW